MPSRARTCVLMRQSENSRPVPHLQHAPMGRIRLPSTTETAARGLAKPMILRVADNLGGRTWRRALPGVRAAECGLRAAGRLTDRHRAVCNSVFGTSEEAQYLGRPPFPASCRGNAAFVEGGRDLSEGVSARSEFGDFGREGKRLLVGAGRDNGICSHGAVALRLHAEDAALFGGILDDHRAVRPVNPFRKILVPIYSGHRRGTAPVEIMADYHRLLSCFTQVGRLIQNRTALAPKLFRSPQRDF